MDDGETRCAVFCIADNPASTLNFLLHCTEEYLSEFNTPNYTAHASDRIVFIDTKDISTITKGSSPPVTSSPTAFLGHTLQEVRDWFDANITQPRRKGYMLHCFLVLDDESTEDDSYIFVCTQDSASGEIHSLRCGFQVDLALLNIVACDIQGESIEEGLMGSFKLHEGRGDYDERKLEASTEWRDVY